MFSDDGLEPGDLVLTFGLDLVTVKSQFPPAADLFHHYLEKLPTLVIDLDGCAGEVPVRIKLYPIFQDSLYRLRIWIHFVLEQPVDVF